MGNPRLWKNWSGRSTMQAQATAHHASTHHYHPSTHHWNSPVSRACFESQTFRRQGFPRRYSRMNGFYGNLKIWCIISPSWHFSGRVEVQLDENGPWGPICGDGWGVREAMVRLEFGTLFSFHFERPIFLILGKLLSFPWQSHFLALETFQV